MPLSNLKEIRIPDIGGGKNVDVIELLVQVGDTVAIDQSLMTLEGDKATMEIPSPAAGKVHAFKIKVGDKVSEGDVILTLECAEEALAVQPSAPPQKAAQSAAPEAPVPSAPPQSPVDTPRARGEIHAGPAVRRIARECGIDLSRIVGTGEKNRITKEDVQQYVQAALSRADGGFSVAAAPAIDFSQFGEIETKPLSRIKKLTGVNLHRSWVSIPHVTQFGHADITEMENFRVQQKENAEKQGVKLTPLVFIIKAVIAALKAYPHFNASLAPNGEQLILKQYFNIGVAVDTPNGLVVPVIRHADQKSIYVLAKELAQISAKAREKGLSLTDMQGGCFTISSLGGIGGTAFTPIINAPEVAILGVSKASIQPVYQHDAFLPRLQLPLSLSYDHRVIDGAEGARFIVSLAGYLSDIRTLLL
jgi:pyruvate dehydrogenase E2 component (dihydrolipoamide acetyltransferase)